MPTNTLLKINEVVVLKYILEQRDKELQFIIHEHHAVKMGLHYDLRLEYEGVLKSWASFKIKELLDDKLKKIILFKQPDHDFNEWINFKGHIDDDYGKGKVKIYDKGTYKIQKWDDNRTIVFTLHGRKVKGTFVLVKMKKDKEYLFFKKK